MKLFKKIAFAAVGAVMAIGLGTGLSLNATNHNVEEASAATAGTYTYNFVTNFSTYASDWSSSYVAHTVSSSDLGTGLPSATFAFSSANKQTGTIKTMPVSKAGNLTLTLNETGFAITSVTATFSQWTTKVPVINVCETSESGTLLYGPGDVGLTGSGATGTVGTTGALTVIGSGINGIFISNTSANQIGWASVEITIAEFTSSLPVTSVAISPASVFLPIGGTKVVSATVLPSNATDPSLTWSLSSVSPLGCVTWDLGTLTLTGVAAGTATLTATANDGSGLYSSISISVVDAYSVKFSVSSDVATALTTGTIGTYLASDGSSMTYTTLTSVYANATNVLKLGTGSSAGSIAFTLPSGYATTQIIILAKAWSGDTTSVAVNSGTAQIISGADFVYYSYSSSLASSITIASTVTSNSRFFISEILLVKQTATDADIVDAFVSGYMHPEIAYNIGDTNTGACSGTTGYYTYAKAHFNNVLTADQKALFVSGAAYTNPYARLLAWATANSEAMLAGNVLGAAASNHINAFNNENYSMTIIVIMSMASIAALGIFYFLRKKKEVK